MIRNYIDDLFEFQGFSLPDILLITLFFGTFTVFFGTLFFLNTAPLFKGIFRKIRELRVEIKDFIKQIILYCLLFLCLLFLFPILIGIKEFHKSYSIPKNLVNIDKKLLKYKKENKLSDSIRILYFNDKYIFMQNERNIEILKFDELFDD